MVQETIEQTDAGGNFNVDWGRIAEETEFEILGTRFFVSKMPAAPARVLWRKLMNEIAKTPLLDALGQMDMDNPGTSLMSAVKGVMTLDADFLGDMERQMFVHVGYAAPGMTKPRPLDANGQSVAFGGFEQADVDELFARAFLINFLASIRRHASRLPRETTESPASSLGE